MSLTTDDLRQIRDIFESSLARYTDEAVKPIQNELAAIRNDLKEIYDRLISLETRMTSMEGIMTNMEGRMTNMEGRMTRLESKIMPEKEFEKLTVKQKLLRLNSELLIAAKQAGVSLPR